MEVKGKNFIKNLEIEMEKKKLKEQTDKLNEQKEETVLFPTSPMSYENADSSIDELDDIVLEEQSNNKQKYIVLAFALVLLFLITIIVIRLLSEPKKQNEFTEDINLNKNIVTTTKKTEPITNIDHNLNINTIDKIEENLSITIPKDNIQKENIKSDVFEIKKDIPEDIKEEKQKVTIEEPNIKEKVLIKENKTKIVNKKDLFKKVKTTNEKTTKIQGYYIQIGAFTKSPNKYLMKTLKNNNLEYAFHKIKIKNKNFTKFLVGPFASHSNAKQKLKKVRKITNNNGAYIIRFK